MLFSGDFTPHVLAAAKTSSNTNISDATAGNLTIKDETGSVYVAGLTKTKVAENDNSFASLGLIKGDTLTLIGTRALDLEEQKMNVSGAYYVSHKSRVVVELFTLTVTGPKYGYLSAQIVPKDEEMYYLTGDISDVALQASVEDGATAPSIEEYLQSEIDAVIAELQLAPEAADMSLAQIIDLYLEEEGSSGTYDD